MSLTVKRKKANRLPPVDGGSYTAACVGIIDIGEQFEKFQAEKQGKYVSKLILIFELLGQTVEVDGEKKPRWLSKEYLASLNEKSNLFKTLTAWRGKPFTEDELSIDGAGFDLKQMAGQHCLLSVTLEEKDGEKYNKVTGVMGVPKGLKLDPPESEILIFDIDDRDEAVFAKLPEWIQTKIRKSTQYQIDPPDEMLDGEDQPAETALPAQETAGRDACPI